MKKSFAPLSFHIFLAILFTIAAVVTVTFHCYTSAELSTADVLAIAFYVSSSQVLWFYSALNHFQSK